MERLAQVLSSEIARTRHKHQPQPPYQEQGRFYSSYAECCHSVAERPQESPKVSPKVSPQKRSKESSPAQSWQPATLLKAVWGRLVSLTAMITAAFFLALLALFLPHPQPVRAANVDVLPVVLPPDSGVQVVGYLLMDDNGTIYFFGVRHTPENPNGLSGVYRLIGNVVEPFILNGSQLAVESPAGLGTIIDIQGANPWFVDTSGRVFFWMTDSQQNQHVLRLEVGGGFTLLAQGPPDTRFDNANPLSDGRWLAHRTEEVQGEDWLRHYLTDGVTHPQVHFAPRVQRECKDRVESFESIDDYRVLFNTQGQSVLYERLANYSFSDDECTLHRQLVEVGYRLRSVSGAQYLEEMFSYNPGVVFNVVTLQINDAGQILRGIMHFSPVSLPDGEADSLWTTQLWVDNTLVKQLSQLESEVEKDVRSMVYYAELQADGSVIYLVERGTDPQAPAGGIYRNAQLLISGDDPLFSEPVNFIYLSKANSRGTIAASYTSETTHGYILLSPTAGRWTNGDGGDWGVATNWAGDEVPGLGNRALFTLPNQYTVNLGTQQVGSVVMQDGDLTWGAGTLNIIGELEVGSLAEQGTTILSIRDQATVNVGEVTVGALPLVETEIVSQIHLFETGVLNVSGPLILGDAAGGSLGLFGGTLTTGETRIGSKSPGHVAAISGQWNSGNLLVGESFRGTIDISTASIQSNFVRIGGGVLATESEPAENALSYSTVMLDSLASDDEYDPATWSIAEGLEIGSGHAGRLQILNGSSVQVGKSVMIDNVVALDEEGEGDASVAVVSGSAVESQQVATWLIGQDLLVGNAAGGSGEVLISAGGIVDVGGTLSIGHQPGSFPLLIVEGVGSSLVAGQAQNSSCTVGFSGSGTFIVRQGGDLHCHAPLFVGLGEEGAILQVADATSRVRAARLEVGAPASSEPTGNGMVVLRGGQIILDQPSTIWENGKLSGNGEIFGELTVMGEMLVDLIEPGLSAASMAATHATPGRLQIDGGLTLGPESHLHLALVGRNLYGQVNVTGTAQLAGTLTLAFAEGYAPRAGDEFHFVNAEKATGAFAAVVVTGLAEGWQYSLETQGGITTLTSNNNGVSLTAGPAAALYMPLVGAR